MSKPIRCTTHFHACDCREYEFEQLRKENQEMREALKWALSTLPHASIDKNDYAKVIDLQNKFNLSETPSNSKEGV